jgi:Na+/H+ antiporter NhaD/arsenite permease-like protein
MGTEVQHTVVYDYLPFIVLLGGLYVITGGIFIDADLEATPRNNTLILIVGAVLASFVGTTGAAMLLIRLILHTNKQRQFKIHTILFFIAVVANCGGLLTPLGDPPLFMMYLRGANFFWFLTLAKEWLFVNGLLIIIYYLVDRHFWNKRETQQIRENEVTEYVPMKISGKLNILWLLIVICAVAFINPHYIPAIKENPAFSLFRDVVIAFAAIMSLVTTKREVRKSNNFTWEPILEVAYLFFGIFLTMVPVLDLLQANATAIGLETPTEFYFVTGALSSVLDNTPTAVTFYSLAEGLFGAHPNYVGADFVSGIPAIFMQAICLGAVFFGSMTYIGNGPNFMVKSIAEQEGVKMPQFFQYIIKFSLIVILPVLILCNILFFHIL